MTFYSGPYNPNNALSGEATRAGILARKIYDAAVAGVVAEALSFMGSHTWVGDTTKRVALINGVRADAAKWETAA